MATKVLSIYAAPGGKALDAAWRTDPQYVYAGRTGKGLDGPMGNPHPVGPMQCRICKTTHQRGEAIEAFKKDLDAVLWRKTTKDEYLQWMDILHHCKDKILLCFCVKKLWTVGDPGPLVCHAQVIAQEADNMQWFKA